MRGRVTKLFPISNTQPLRSSRLTIIPEWGARGTRYANGRRSLCTAEYLKSVAARAERAAERT